MSASDEPSVSGGVAEPTAIMDAASAAKLRNILLYGIQLHQSKVSAGSLPVCFVFFLFLLYSGEPRVHVLRIRRPRETMGNFGLEPCFSLGMFYALGKVDFVFDHVLFFLYVHFTVECRFCFFLYKERRKTFSVKCMFGSGECIGIRVHFT